jgi:hypothetical protein
MMDNLDKIISTLAGKEGYATKDKIITKHMIVPHTYYLHKNLEYFPGRAECGGEIMETWMSTDKVAEIERKKEYKLCEKCYGR